MNVDFGDGAGAGDVTGVRLGDRAGGGFGGAVGVGLGAGVEQPIADVTSIDINSRTSSNTMMIFPYFI